MTILLTLLVGILSSLIVSLSLARPVKKLSDEVEEAQKNNSTSLRFSNTGIRELDQFAGAITQMNQDMLTISTKFLRIMEMASEYMTDEECREFRQRYLDIRSQLVLEITEQELLSKEALERKTSKGFLGAVALDDYGSGYNSEKSLLALSPKYIKVDMVIIRDIDTDIDKQQIVANIVKYAHQRGIYIVAEGVETAEELKKVLELEVDLLQGYYLSRPAATPGAINPDALKIIEENRKR
jgi:diguanylate cyclase (GGDEF) domain